MQAQHAALERAEFGKRPLGVLNLGEDAARLGKQRSARFGEDDAPADAVEQPDVVAGFERSDRVARGRLGEVERPRPFRHVPALRDGDENAQLLERHGASPFNLESRS